MATLMSDYGSIKSNNPSASFFDFFSKSGTDASDPYIPSSPGEVEFTTPGTYNWVAPPLQHFTALVLS